MVFVLYGFGTFLICDPKFPKNIPIVTMVSVAPTPIAAIMGPGNPW